MSKPTRLLGRYAIDALKQHYVGGGSFENCWAVLDFVRALGGKYRKVGIAVATDWERQARYEGWDNLVAVSAPNAGNAGLRDPQVDYLTHLHSERTLHRHIRTRKLSRLRYAKAVAAEPGAPSTAHERVGRLSVEVDIEERELAWIEMNLAKHAT